MFTIIALFLVIIGSSAFSTPEMKSSGETEKITVVQLDYIQVTESDDGITFEFFYTQAEVEPVDYTCYQWTYYGSYTNSVGQTIYVYRQQCCNGGWEVTFLDCYFNFAEVPVDQ